MSNNIQNTVESAVQVGMTLATPMMVNETAIPYAVVPNTASILSLEKFLNRPTQIESVSTFTRAQSLVAFVQKFKNEATTLSFDEDRLTFTVYVEDHLPTAPSWRRHQGLLTLNYSPEAKAWIDGAGKNRARDQEDFALFLEDHLIDVVDPKGTDMLQMVLEFKSMSTASFSRAIRLADGNIQLSYSAENKAGNAQFPERMKIAIPIFNGQRRTEIDLRVRYRIQDAKLVLWYEVINWHSLLRQVVEQYVAEVEFGTGLSVLFRRSM